VKLHIEKKRRGIEQQKQYKQKNAAAKQNVGNLV
jgi:hypothetical protein